MDDQVSIPGSGNDGIFFFTTASTLDSGAHPASSPKGTRVKWLGCKSNYSPPFYAKVMNAWSYVSTPPISLHGVVLT